MSTINANSSGIVLTGNTDGTLDLATGGTTRMVIDGSGNVGIGTASYSQKLAINSANTNTNSLIEFKQGDVTQGYVGFGQDNILRLQTVGTQAVGLSTFGAGYAFITTNDTERMRIDSSGNVGIGGTASGNVKFQLQGNMPVLGGNANSHGHAVSLTVPSAITSAAYAFRSLPTTEAASFTLGNLYHFQAQQNPLGAGSAVTNQYGFFAASQLTGATNNYGFYGDIASGSNRYNVYMAGTASNYFAGNVGIGTATPGAPLDVVNDSSANGVYIRGRSSDNIGTLRFFSNDAVTQYGAIRAASDEMRFNAVTAIPLTFGTSNTERMRIDSSGNVGIGGTAATFSKLNIIGTLPTASNTTHTIRNDGTIPSGSTGTSYGYVNILNTQAASFTASAYIHFFAFQSALGAGSAVTDQYGFAVSSTLTGATNNYGFHSNIASAANRWNFYAAGTANNYFAGDVRIGTTADLGQGARLNILSAEAEADLITLRYTNSSAGKHWRIAIDSASTFLLLNQAATPVGVQLTDGGNSWSSYSDERQKTDLKPIEDAASKVGTLRAVTGRYTFDEKTESRSFLIAQDVQKVLPEAVKQGADGNLLLAYQDVIPLLTKAIQELTARVAELEAK